MLINASIQANELTIASIKKLCSPEYANLIPSPTAGNQSVRCLTRFLQNRRDFDLRLLRALAEANNIISPSEGPTQQSELLLSAFSFVDSLTYFLEMLGWISILRDIFRGGSRSQHEEGTLAAIVLGFIGMILTVILGLTAGIVVITSMKIHKASRYILRQKASVIKLQQKLGSSSESSALSRAAALTALQGSQYTINAYKVFKASSIYLLVVGIIATLALLALVAGIVLAAFFTGPGAATIISAAVIGCCASGAIAFSLAIVGFILATLDNCRKQAKTSYILQKALLHTAMSERLLQHPERFRDCSISKAVLDRCLNNHRYLFSSEDLMALGLQGSESGDNLWAGVQSSPPSYEEAVGSTNYVPPPYNPDHHVTPSAPPPPYE